MDAFLKVDGIEGASQDKKHDKWIPIESYSLGATQPLSGHSAGTAKSAERVQVQDFSVVKHLDKASPKLFEACCSGKHIKEVIIELCHATGEQTRFMEYKLSDCMVSSVRPGGSSGGDGLPMEEVSFHYSKIEMKFTATDEKGKPKGDVSAKYDLVKNTV